MTKNSAPKDDAGDEAWHRYTLEPQESPVEGVIQAAGAVTNTPTNEMEVLNDAIDPDALDVLFAPGRDASPIHLSFEYAGCEVEVSNPYIRIRERE